MAKFELYFDTLIKHEGGYVDDPLDAGGATKYGITLNVWKKRGYDKNKDGKIDKEDVKLLTKEDALKIAKEDYWDPIKGDDINNQSIAEFIFDWGYNSGIKTAIKKVQEIVGVPVDGIVGPVTLKAINQYPPKELFNKLKKSRENFYLAIVRNRPSQKKFLKGWLNRNNSFKFAE